MKDNQPDVGAEPENAGKDPNTRGFLEFALMVAENLRIVVLIPLAAGLIAFVLSYTVPPTFTATTKLLPPQQQQSLAAALANQFGALASAASALGPVKNPADTYVAMLKSRSIADRLIKRFGLKQIYKVDFDEEARGELASRTRVSTGREGFIVISVDDQSPQRAAELANGYVDELQALTQTLAVTEAGQRRQFFERRMQQAKDDLTRAELALRGAGINQATLNAVPQSALEFVASLKARITTQEIKLAALRGFMTESNPEFKQTQNELMALRAQLAKTEQNDPAIGNGRGAEYITRLREFKYYEALFELMAKQYELARVDEAREGATIQVVDAAVRPEFKSKPKKAQIAVVTTLVALLLTLLALGSRQAFRNTMANPETAAKFVRLRQLLRVRRR
jgi:uncharacterized protein involved in exopolysaccharide biosynthesis